MSNALRSGGFLGRRGSAFDHPHDVALLHDEELYAIELDVGPRPLAEQDAVSDRHVEGHELAALVAGAGTDRQNLAFLRLLLGGVGDDDASFRLLFRVDALDDDAIVQRAKLHYVLLSRLSSGERRLPRAEKFGIRERSFKRDYQKN